MPDLDVEIKLQGGAIEHGTRHYEPETEIEGCARLTPERSVDARRVVARLQWHTEGRGDRDKARPDEVELASGPLTEPLVRNFTLSVPQQPWSYTGELINIIWQVVVVVDIPHAFDIHAEETIVVAPRRLARPTTTQRTYVPPDAV